MGRNSTDAKDNVTVLSFPFVSRHWVVVGHHINN